MAKLEKTRVRLVEVIRTPLAFFVLAVLVVDVTFGVAVTSLPDADADLRFYLLMAMVTLFLIVSVNCRFVSLFST